MNALVNSLTSEPKTDLAASTTNATNDPVAAKDIDSDDEAEDGYVGERMVDVGIDPLTPADIEFGLKSIFDANSTEYVKNQALIDDVGQRIVDELELMIRMLNPDSQYRPEWFVYNEDETVLTAITTRDDLTEVYRDSLVETYELITEEIADDIVEYIAGVVSDHEAIASEYYAPIASADE